MPARKATLSSSDQRTAALHNFSHIRIHHKQISITKARATPWSARSAVHRESSQVRHNQIKEQMAEEAIKRRPMASVENRKRRNRTHEVNLTKNARQSAVERIDQSQIQACMSEYSQQLMLWPPLNIYLPFQRWRFDTAWSTPWWCNQHINIDHSRSTAHWHELGLISSDDWRRIFQGHRSMEHTDTRDDSTADGNGKEATGDHQW